MPKRKPQSAPVQFFAPATKYDLPVRTIAEGEAERRTFFDKAWAQKAAREAAEKRGETFVPDWLKKQRAANNPVFLKAAQPSKRAPTGHAAAVAAALNAPSSDEEDERALQGPRPEGKPVSKGYSSH